MGIKRDGPKYVVFSPFTSREDYEEFAKYEDAVGRASLLSKHIPVQIEVQFVEPGQGDGRRVAVCQNGTLFQVHQPDLFRVDNKLERKLLADLGKAFWISLEQVSKQIRVYQHQMTPLTDGDRLELTMKQQYLDTVLMHLEEDLSETELAAVKWKYVDCARYNNRLAEKPKVLEGYCDSTIRKFHGAAFVKTGKVMSRERWTANPDVMCRILQEQSSDRMISFETILTS